MPIPTATPTIARPNQDVASETILDLARADKNVLVVTSDSRGSGKLMPFSEELPDQLVEVGIAEQNLVGVAAGLASTGKTVFAVSPACFLTARSLEQIKNDVCYSNHPVNLIGISSGVSYGALGSTHHATHDFAVLRAIHNLDVLAPADAWESREAILAAARSDRPVYLRFGKFPVPQLDAVEQNGFEVGKSRLIRNGTDLAFLATGETVWRALEAAEILEKEDGLSCRVVSMHTIKPLDAPAVLSAGQDCGAVLTVEEHSVHGGLGEACAAVLAASAVSPRLRIVGIPDEDTVTGKQEDILNHYGISVDGLAATAREVLA